MSNRDPQAPGAVAVVIKPVYSIPEFCHDFATSRSAAYEEMKAGRLRSFKYGAATRIAGEDALSWRKVEARQGRLNQ